MKLGWIAAVAVLTCALFAQERLREERVSIMGVSINDAQNDVRTALAKVAEFQREEEGQQIWAVKGDPRIQSLIVGYDADHRVRYVTAIAKPGLTLLCTPLGDIDTARRSGKPGNFLFTRALSEGDASNETKKEAGGGISVIAQGTDSTHLFSCSLKKLGARSAGEGEEELRGRH